MMTNKSYFFVYLLFIIALAGPFACNQNSEKSSRQSQDEDTSMMDDGMGMNGMHGMEDMPGMQKMHERMMDSGRMMMMSQEEMQGMGPEMMQDMRVIHSLLTNHEKIKRRVKNIPGGIESWTESEDPEIAAAIQTHVMQMKERMEQGEPIRMMDPVFRELFDHRKQINLNVEKTPKGVHVTETSDDPKVVALIRQHAHQAVSEFAKYGMERAMKPTPLPEGYDYNGK